MTTRRKIDIVKSKASTNEIKCKGFPHVSPIDIRTVEIQCNQCFEGLNDTIRRKFECKMHVLVNYSLWIMTQ